MKKKIIELASFRKQKQKDNLLSYTDQNKILTPEEVQTLLGLIESEDLEDTDRWDWKLVGAVLTLSVALFLALAMIGYLLITLV